MKSFLTGRVKGGLVNKREFKEAIDKLVASDVDDLTWDERLSVVRQRLVEAEKGRVANIENKGKPWTDEELRMILKSAPTSENCMLLARAFRRGYGSIEQIFRWAAEDLSSINEKRPYDSFVKQIKRIAKEVGWRAT